MVLNAISGHVEGHYRIINGTRITIIGACLVL